MVSLPFKTERLVPVGLPFLPGFLPSVWIGVFKVDEEDCAPWPEWDLLNTVQSPSIEQPPTFLPALTVLPLRLLTNALRKIASWLSDRYFVLPSLSMFESSPQQKIGVQKPGHNMRTKMLELCRCVQVQQESLTENGSIEACQRTIQQCYLRATAQWRKREDHAHKCFLLDMCKEAPVSISKCLSSGLVEEGAGIISASARESHVSFDSFWVYRHPLPNSMLLCESAAPVWGFVIHSDGISVIVHKNFVPSCTDFVNIVVTTSDWEKSASSRSVSWEPVPRK